MLNDLENVIKNFFNQYGFSVKSSNSQIDTDQVARLLADQVFLHIISQGNTPMDADVSPSSKPARKPHKNKDTSAEKPKRKYQRKANVETEAVEGAV